MFLKEQTDVEVEKVLDNVQVKLEIINVVIKNLLFQAF